MLVCKFTSMHNLGVLAPRTWLFLPNQLEPKLSWNVSVTPKHKPLKITSSNSHSYFHNPKNASSKRKVTGLLEQINQLTFIFLGGLNFLMWKKLHIFEIHWHHGMGGGKYWINKVFYKICTDVGVEARI